MKVVTKSYWKKDKCYSRVSGNQFFFMLDTSILVLIFLRIVMKKYKGVKMRFAYGLETYDIKEDAMVGVRHDSDASEMCCSGKGSIQCSGYKCENC